MTESTVAGRPSINFKDVADHSFFQLICWVLLTFDTQHQWVSYLGLTIVWIVIVMQFCTASLGTEAKFGLAEKLIESNRYYPHPFLFAIIAVMLTFVLAYMGHLHTAVAYAVSCITSLYNNVKMYQYVHEIYNRDSNAVPQDDPKNTKHLTTAEEKRQARRQQYKEITQRVNDRNYS